MSTLRLKRIRTFKHHSVSTRLPRKEAEIRQQLYDAVSRALAPKAGRG